jgi:hypothetical protein
MPLKEMLALARGAQDLHQKPINALTLPGSNEKIDGLWYYEPDEAALAYISGLFRYGS